MHLPNGAPTSARPVTGLVSQTGRQLMRKGSFSGLGSPIGIPPVSLKPSLSTPGPGLQKSASDSLILPPLKAGTGRPSTVARRENRRRQMLAEQMMERTERSENVAETGLVADRLDSFEVLSEAFGHDVRGVTDRLEDMARSIRFENWRSKTEEKERKRREEEKRLQEEEKRKARKREQEAADPKKKVALRIESRRRFDGDNEKAASIPMHPVEVDGPQGRETVSLVDVENLQNRCLQLKGRAGIEAFIDMVRAREQREASKKDLDSLSPRSAKSVGMKSSISGYSTRESLQSVSWDERRQSVLARRQALRVEAILKKLCSMRSGLPLDMCIEVGSLQAYFDFEKTRPDPEIESLQTVVAQNLNGLIDNLANKLAAAPESTSSSLLRSLGKLTQCATSEQLSMSGRFPEAKSRASTDRTLELELTRMRTKQRARRARAILRALARWTMVFCTVQKRNKCVEMIKVTLGQLGEWARVKSAMKKAVDSVRRIQQNCRTFLVSKRERCKQIEKEWDRVESAQLERFHQQFAKKLFKGQAEKPGAKKGRRMLLAQALQPKGNAKSNWKPLKIPEEVRARMVSFYYMARLRTKVRTTADLLKTVRMALAKHREVNGFLSFFGTSVNVEESFAQPKTQGSWWDASQEALLYMIGLSAQTLKAKEVQPYADHPAHKDLPGNAMFVKPQMDYSTILADGSTALDLAILRLLQRSCLERLYKSDPELDAPATVTPLSIDAINGPMSDDEGAQSPKTRDSPAASPKAGDKRSDLEDVLASFTPRLRAIREEQECEYRISFPRSSEREVMVHTSLW